MKKIIVIGILLILSGITYTFKENILLLLTDTFINNNREHTKIVKNEYYNKNEYAYIQNTDNFIPNNKKDIEKIFFTVINSGMKSFTFYCPNKYTDCIEDVKNVSENQKLLSDLNNFIHPFNSFKNIETQYDSLGKVIININHTYSKEEINKLNQKIDSILKVLIKENMLPIDKIKVIHDYVINNAKYDTDKSDNKLTIYKSDTAYGTLIEGFGICGGYSDAAYILLDKIGIKNYKISSENHIWNLVNIDNSWKHLDLTWDDPVTENKQDMLNYDYFLIDTKRLKELEPEQHNFNINIYKEAK